MDSILITLIIIFIGVFAFGFFIIYKQVALIKKGEFKLKDRLQCFIYGFIFSLAVIVVLGMAIIFTIETPEFWKESSPPKFNPIFFLIPFTICLAYISFYPLIDFLFIALSGESDEGLTPFHKFIGEKIINKTNYKLINVLIAIAFYCSVFFLPPILLSLLGLPFIMIWISWMLIYPLMILTFYGSKGYIAQLSTFYLFIPEIKRSVFLGFEDGKRIFKEFQKGWVPRILVGLMIFVYVWAWISMIQTIGFYFTATMPFAIMSSIFVFVTLFLGVLGYFTRFWARKIKYRGIDIYFAAYLIATISINILVNFLILNAEKLKNIFDFWDFTSDITANYLMFAFAAAIEELVLLIFTTYYFLSKRNEFKRNIRYSIITQCGQTFNPIPLFNLIKNKNREIRNHAEEILIMMYERIPLKEEINLNDMKYKNPLIDGVCDPHPNSKRICYRILLQLEKDVPEIVLSWIIESLESPNYDKSIPFAQSLLMSDLSLVERIPKNIIYNLINDSEWRLKLLGLKILSRLIKKDKSLISDLNIKNYLNDPDSRIQVEILNIIANSSEIIPINILMDKLDHSNKFIRAAAIKNIQKLKPENINSLVASKLIPLIKDPTSSVRASIFRLLSKIGSFKKFSIPIQPFFEGLTDKDEKVRKASISVLEKYLNEDPSLLDIDFIISKIDPNNIDILNSVLSLLGKFWEENPEKILTTLLIFIKFDNEQLKENISKILIEKYSSNPDLIIKNLIKTPDISKYITKGIVSRTIVKIAKNDTKNVIPKLIKYLKSNNDDIRLNAIMSLEGLAEDYSDVINIKPFIMLLESDKNQQIKKEASKVISKVAVFNPLSIKSNMAAILQLIHHQEPSVKITISKCLLEIARKTPDIIPIPQIIKFLSDKDSFIRESAAKILGFIGNRSSEETIDALFNIGLVDEDWIVREASISSLGEIIDHIESKDLIIKKLVSFLDDEKSWVKRSAMNILANIEEINNSDIPLEKVLKNSKDRDPKVREASAGLLKIYGLEDISRVIDSIISLLDDESKDVRNKMVNDMVLIINKIGLITILSRLLKNLSGESSIELQRSIALILERTARYEAEKIKKRVISLLKIRCEMSQDPIICEALHKIRES
ncbi:MAG: HEAT repeat domain-containing protein [Candidatus Hodarchaeota archaeon]